RSAGVACAPATAGAGRAGLVRAPGLSDVRRCIAATHGMRQASVRFSRTDVRVRPVFRLLPLPLCIALSLGAHADDDRPQDWSLCPVEDAVPAFADAPPPTGAPVDRESQNTDVAGDSVEGVTGATINFQGNVTLRRGDQFLHADNLRF